MTNGVATSQIAIDEFKVLRMQGFSTSEISEKTGYALSIITKHAPLPKTYCSRGCGRAINYRNTSGVCHNCGSWGSVNLEIMLQEAERRSVCYMSGVILAKGLICPETFIRPQWFDGGWNWDHVRGTKESNVTDLLTVDSARIIAEMNKCELTCIIHHRKKTNAEKNPASLVLTCCP